ncbi:MAG: ATP synthase F0 subunit B [Deltaproteobacteria bacterium]|nr:ATP synthase F0 subunit B [Deltaproteobacteria bacterium]
MKQNKDIVVIGCIFFVVAYGLQRIDFWTKIDMPAPHGLFIQGGLFLVLMLLFHNFVFGPFLHIAQERENQTVGKRKDALLKQEQAEKMLAQYDDAITQAKIKAVTTRQSIAMQAEEEERKTIEHARKISDERLQKELKEIAAKAEAAQKDLQKDVPEVAREIFNQVFANKEAGVS